MNADTTDRRVFRAALGVAALQFRLIATFRTLSLLGLLALGPMVLIVALQTMIGDVARGSDRTQWSAIYLYWAQVRVVLPLAGLLVGASIWSEEIESGTLVYVLTRPVPRAAAYAAKWVVAWHWVAAVAALASVGTWGVLAVTGGAGLDLLWPLLLVTTVGSAAYTAIFGLLAVATGRGFIAGLVFGGVTEIIAWALDLVARKLAVVHYTASALSRMGPYRDLPAPILVGQGEAAGPWEVWLVLGAATLGAVALAGVIVRLREYAPTRSN